MTFTDYINEKTLSTVYVRSDDKVRDMPFEMALIQITHATLKGMSSKTYDEKFDKFKDQIKKLLLQKKIIYGGVYTYYSVDKSKLSDPDFDPQSKEVIRNIFGK